MTQTSRLCQQENQSELTWFFGLHSLTSGLLAPNKKRPKRWNIPVGRFSRAIFFKTVYNCTIVHVHKSHIREIVPQLKIFVNQIPPPNCLHNIEFCRISFVPIFLQLSHPFFLMKYFWDNPENFYNSWKPPRRLETLAMIRNFAAPPETSQSIKKPLPDSFLSVQQLFRLSGNFWSCWISCSNRCKNS